MAPAIRYMLIDITTVEETAVLLVGSMRQAQLFGRLLKAKGRKVIAPPIEGRGFSKLELLQLQYLFWNMTQQRPPDDYGEMIAVSLATVRALPDDPTSLEYLEAECAKLEPDAEGMEVEPSETTQQPRAKATHAPRTPRPPREPGEAPVAPPASSTTGKVWVIAQEQLDSIYPQTGAPVDWKTVRAAVMLACERAGINKATAATQYSKFKASKGV